jgi:TonB family protein
VLPAVRNSIRGTVQVIVNVNVDHEGNVEDAVLAVRGPSKYFDREALQAARLWKFNPPRIGGQGVLSSWRLQFEFTRGSAKVIPMQEMP